LRMLQSRKKKRVSEREMTSVIEILTERVYAHGHAIGLTEAKAIGLPVKAADDALDRLMWQLLNEYEADLRLLEPLDPVTTIANSDLHTEVAVMAVIESTWGVHEHAGQIEVRARRQPPPNLNLALNLNIKLPEGLDPQQQISEQAQQAVQDALRAQSPLVGVETALRGAQWTKAW
jgi:hypothetical protein